MEAVSGKAKRFCSYVFLGSDPGVPKAYSVFASKENLGFIPDISGVYHLADFQYGKGLWFNRAKLMVLVNNGMKFI